MGWQTVGHSWATSLSLLWVLWVVSANGLNRGRKSLPVMSLLEYMLLLSHSVMSSSLRPHGLQHSRLPCPSLSPRICSNSCPLSLWFHPTISSSVALFCPQSFPAPGPFPMSQLFVSGGQSITASASASVLPVNIQDWFPSGLTIWSLCSPKDSQESSPTPQSKSINSLARSLFYDPILTSYMTTGKTTALMRWTFVGKVMSLLFNMISWS